jgi:hypothetical protein
MTRACLLALTLLALAFPAVAAAEEPLWPLGRTPLTLAPEACAADAKCARYVAVRDLALAGESAEQRAEREADVLGFATSRKADRAVVAAVRDIFDVSDLSDTPVLQRRLRRALSLGALRAGLRRELALRGWSQHDLGDLFAIEFLVFWRFANGRRTTDPASDAAFRDGLRDLLARDRRTRRLDDARRQLAGEQLALVAIGFERMAAAMPAAARSQIRRISVNGTREMLRAQFGIDPLRLRQVPSGFSAK